MINNEKRNSLYEELLDSILDEVKEKFLNLNNDKTQHFLFNDKLDEWLEYKNITTKKSTYAYYHFIIDKHIRPYFKETEVDYLDKNIVNDFVKYKLSDENISDSTVRQILKVLRQIVRYFKLDIDVMMPKNKKNDICILSEKENKRLLNYLISNLNEESFGIILSMTLGLRIGEVCALRWSNFDIEHELIRIENTVERIKNYDNTSTSKTSLMLMSAKTDNSVRVLPLSHQLISLIKDLKIKCNRNSFILTSSDKFMDPRTFYNHYKKIIEKCNINSNYHCLRHTFATQCINNGLNVKAVSEILGHSNVQTTLSTYVHPNLSKTREFLNEKFTY